jgi:hypothetical protein
VNINIGGQLAALLGQGQPGVTGGNNIPGMLGALNAQRAPKPVMAPAFNPMQNISDFVDPNRMHPQNGMPTPQTPATPAQSPLQDLMRQITDLMGSKPPNIQFDPISMPKYDVNQFKGQAEQIVGDQYNPIIQDLLNQQKGMQQKAGTNQKAVGDLYNQLAAYAGQDVNTSNQQYDTAQAQSKQLYTDERSKIAAQYAADAANQKAEAKQLGTQAFGTGDVIAKQTADRQFMDQQSSQQMQAQNGALESQQTSAADYSRAMQGAARSQGAEGQQNIIQQLSDYMTQSDSNLAQTRSQEAGSVADLMTKLADSTYQRDAANTQFGYQQQRDYIGDQNTLYGNEMDLKMQQLQAMQTAQTAAGSSATKLNPWQQTATFADQLQPGHGQDFVAAIQKAMSQRQEISGINPTGPDGQPVKMNSALFAQLIGDSEAAGGLDRNKLMMVSQELYKLLYG